MSTDKGDSDVRGLMLTQILRRFMNVGDRIWTLVTSCECSCLAI